MSDRIQAGVTANVVCKWCEEPMHSFYHECWPEALHHRITRLTASLNEVMAQYARLRNATSVADLIAERDRLREERNHYRKEWLERGNENARLRAALEESVRLQAHYAKLLNMYDGGERIEFANADEWLARLIGDGGVAYE